ncbi:MAG: hypothetical protein JW726_09320 [Anaerolineales bacterium]|nr:hypothetical protein [Anaerolineales bacterium]
MNNKFVLLALLAVGMLLLSACTINVHTEINKDGSGTWSTEIGMTAEDQQSLTDYGYASVEAYCQEAQADMPANTTMTIEQRGEETFCVYSVPFANLEELKTVYGDSEDLAINRLEIVDGILYYDLTMTGGSDDMGMGGVLSSNWIVTMPGTIQSHNATNQEGNTLTWNLVTTQTINIQAQSKVSGFAFPNLGTTELIVIALSCLCCVVLIIVIAVVVFLVMRKRKQAAGQPAVS